MTPVASAVVNSVYGFLTAVDPGRTLLVDLASQSTLSYGEVTRQADTLAGWLHSRGVRSGDRVAIQLRKGVEEVVSILACIRLGAVFVDMHPLWKGERVQQVLRDCGAKLAIVERASVSAVSEHVEHVLCVGIEAPAGSAAFVQALADVHEAPDVFDDPTALATLLYTSGSTGKAKGVMHSHGNLVRFADNVSQYLDNRADDRLLSVLPFGFGYGLSQLLTMLRVGGAVVMQRSPFATDIVAALIEHGVTGFAGVASVWSQVVAVLEAEPGLSAKLQRLRYVTNAGGKLPSALAERLRAALPDTDLILMYGSTEALRTTFVPPDAYGRKQGAIGWPTPGVRAFVITEDGQVAGPGQCGEIVHVGDHTMMGYWNDEAATRRKLRPCAALGDYVGDRPVLFTEDLATIDEDGCLWFESRASWMVKSAGFRFSLTEVEDAVEASGLVGGVMAFALDDDAQGQVVELVVAGEGLTDESAGSLLKALRKTLPRYMLPRKVHQWTGALPLTANGKLDRHATLAALGLPAAGAPHDGV